MTPALRCEWRVCERDPDCPRPVDFTFVLDPDRTGGAFRSGIVKPRCVVHRYTYWGKRDTRQLFEHIGEASGWTWDCGL